MIQHGNICVQTVEYSSKANAQNAQAASQSPMHKCSPTSVRLRTSPLHNSTTPSNSDEESPGKHINKSSRMNMNIQSIRIFVVLPTFTHSRSNSPLIRSVFRIVFICSIPPAAHPTSLTKDVPVWEISKAHVHLMIAGTHEEYPAHPKF